jgi:hypothetical protein
VHLRQHGIRSDVRYRRAHLIIKASDNLEFAFHHRLKAHLGAFMLGMRRVGITTAAAALQRRGLIKYRQVVLTVLNRRGLLSSACSCYAADRKTYNRLLP